MKILHVISRLHPDDGGPVRTVIDLANAMQGRGHQVMVACWRNSQLPESWDDWSTPGSPSLLNLPHAERCRGLFSNAWRGALAPIVAEHDVLQLHGIWEPPVLLFLSRIHPKKGPDRLIDAVVQLAERLPVQAVFAGSGDSAYINVLRTRAHRWGVGDRVHFVGHVGAISNSASTSPPTCSSCQPARRNSATCTTNRSPAQHRS